MCDVSNDKRSMEIQQRPRFRVREHSPNVAMPELLTAWRATLVEKRLREELGRGGMRLTCAPVCHLFCQLQKRGDLASGIGHHQRLAGHFPNRYTGLRTCTCSTSTTWWSPRQTNGGWLLWSRNRNDGWSALIWIVGMLPVRQR